MSVEDYVVFELTSLETFHALEFQLGHIVPVHVHQDVLDHDNAQLFLLPDLIHLLQQVFLAATLEFVDYWLQELHRRILDSLVEQIPMLVKH